MAGEKSVKVMVVEDNESLLMALEHDIQQAGYQVLTATNGRQALKIARQECPNLIISDLAMPEMDGIQFCRRLRRSNRFANVPFIFLSAYGEPKDRIKGLRSGADDYVVKPFDLDELIARIHVHCRRKKQADSTQTLSGDLHEIQLSDILQIFEHTKKQGILLIRDGRQKGYISFRDGMVMDARLAHNRGEDALAEIFMFEKGSFRYYPKKINSGALSQRISHLMLNLLRLIDEKNALSDYLPDRNQTLVFKQMPDGDDETVNAVAKILRSRPQTCEEIKRHSKLSWIRIEIAAATLIRDQCVIPAAQSIPADADGKTEDPLKFVFLYVDEETANQAIDAIHKVAEQSIPPDRRRGIVDLRKLTIFGVEVDFFAIQALRESSFFWKPLLTSVDAAVFLVTSAKEREALETAQAFARPGMPFHIVRRGSVDFGLNGQIEMIRDGAQISAFLDKLIQEVSQTKRDR